MTLNSALKGQEARDMLSPRCKVIEIDEFAYSKHLLTVSLVDETHPSRLQVFTCLLKGVRFASIVTINLLISCTCVTITSACLQC